MELVQVIGAVFGCGIAIGVMIAMFVGFLD
jgi:hypothetical protein